jgi:hypothetical protein
MRGRNHLEKLGIDGRIILKHRREIRIEGVDWIDLAQDRDWWWALVNMIMNVQVA